MPFLCPVRPVAEAARFRGEPFGYYLTDAHAILIHGNGTARSGKLNVGALTVDYDKHRVFMDGADVGLTLNEYRIVELLSRHVGKVLTYDYIIRELWGSRVRASNQLLRVNMAHIRRKIEKNPAAPNYFFTEIGVGYRMRDEDEQA